MQGNRILANHDQMWSLGRHFAWGVKFVLYDFGCQKKMLLGLCSQSSDAANYVNIGQLNWWWYILWVWTIELTCPLKTVGIILWMHTVYQPSVQHQRLDCFCWIEIVCIWKNVNWGEGGGYITWERQVKLGLMWWLQTNRAVQIFLRMDNKYIADGGEYNLSPNPSAMD